MKKLYFILILFIFAIIVSAQNNMEDVVYLKNGGILRGMIIEQIPNQSLKIQTRDGNVFVYNFSEIEKITKEPGTQIEQQRNVQKNEQHRYVQNMIHYKNPAVAGLWSLFICGGGQFYNGENGKGFLMLGLEVTTFCLMVAGAGDSEYDSYYNDHYQRPSSAFYLGVIGYLGVGIWSIVDAVSSANKINRNNELGINLQLNKNTSLSLQPDIRMGYYGGNSVTPVLGGKVALSLK